MSSVSSQQGALWALNIDIGSPVNMVDTASQKSRQHRRPTILLVDDDPVILMSLEALLAPLHCQIQSCASGKDAIYTAESLLPDLILLDIMLPEVDGYEVLEQLRQLPVLDTTPIVLMSALDYSDEIQMAFEKGADDLIQKPFPKGVLRARVQNLIQLNRQRKILEAGAKAERAMNRSHSGFIEVNDAYDILWVNPRGRSILGITDVEEHFKTGYSLIDLLGQMQAITRPGNAFDVDADWENEEPRYVWLCSPDREEGSWFMFRPISREIHAGRRTVWFEIRDIEGKFARARERMSFQQAMSHKLNTPLHQAMMAIQCLCAEHNASEIQSDEQESMLQIASDAIGSLHTHVQKILQHTFVSQNKSYTGNGVCVSRFERIIHNVCEIIPSLSQLDVNVLVEQEEARYGISEESFSMVVRELIDNAVKFHPKQAPSIQVDIRACKDDFLEVAFMDDGIGVEPSKLAWMSQPYTQLEDDPTGNVPGVGLGLSTITLVVWEMGGWLSFENRTDQKGLMVKIGLKRLSAA